ncbi:MAG: hypothetical protein HY876_10615 [Coriobacteriales bacterium]|nr:hypothetical protein [Coriobacteriales bacterium]
MTKRQTRMLALAILLLLALALLGGWYWYYRNTKQLAFDLTADAVGAIPPPQFLYAFSGQGKQRLERPIGVSVVNGEVFVADAVRRGIHVFDEGGNWKRSFGTSETVVPLYVAHNPANDRLYVSDRRERAVKIFTLEGKYLGEFDPKLPKKQLPKFKTGGVQWAPVAIAFADDGTMYATEILNGHRLLIFKPDGTFKKSIGDAGIVNVPTEGENLFQFPNGLMVAGNKVYVADSNNRRIQVFDREGEFQKVIVTQGLPRGITPLGALPSDDSSAPVRFVEVDTLAHDATIWTGEGEKILSFGEQGVLDGQFNYPDAVALGSKNKIFVTDTANGRVQVWGWPTQVASMPQVSPNNLWMCLLPLLLLPLLLLLRKKRFVATPDFVHAMVELDRTDLMPKPRRKWLAIPDDWAVIKTIEADDLDMGELFEETEYSESDAQSLIEKLEIDEKTAGELALAQRGKLFCTESPELRRLAKVLEVEVVNAKEFVERFASKEEQAPAPRSED